MLHHKAGLCATFTIQIFTLAFLPSLPALSTTRLYSFLWFFSWNLPIFSLIFIFLKPRISTVIGRIQFTNSFSRIFPKDSKFGLKLGKFLNFYFQNPIHFYSHFLSNSTSKQTFSSGFSKSAFIFCQNSLGTFQYHSPFLKLANFFEFELFRLFGIYRFFFIIPGKHQLIWCFADRLAIWSSASGRLRKSGLYWLVQGILD